MNDTELQRRFEDQSILNHDFSHEKHIRIAYIYLSQNDFEQGLEMIIAGIKKLNAVNKVPEALRTRGFHQTLTLAWAKLVKVRLQDGKFGSSLDFLEQYPELLDPRLVNEYYSTEYLMSWEAKRGFVEPDIKSLEKS